MTSKPENTLSMKGAALTSCKYVYLWLHSQQVTRKGRPSGKMLSCWHCCIICFNSYHAKPKGVPTPSTHPLDLPLMGFEHNCVTNKCPMRKETNGVSLWAIAALLCLEQFFSLKWEGAAQYIGKVTLDSNTYSRKRPNYDPSSYGSSNHKKHIPALCFPG